MLVDNLIYSDLIFLFACKVYFKSNLWYKFDISYFMKKLLSSLLWILNI